MRSDTLAGGCTAFAAIGLLLSILGLGACTSQPAPSKVPANTLDAAAAAVEPPAGAESPDSGYVLEPGDIIGISVWREPGLEDTVLVRPDGGISFPLAGELDVEGKTIAEVSLDLTQRLEEFIPDPVVTVSLQQIEGNRVYVTGRVNRPGGFVLTRPVDVMQALSMAGGLSPFADKDAIKILRRKNGRQVAIPFNYKKVQKGRDLQQNILLQAGDTLVVP
ncbi:MAG: polysaccharide export protein [Gammaproteobacteria bacterium]|nr:polysaccharide export protein [Gammaproteobacteria bacterium]